MRTFGFIVAIILVVIIFIGLPVYFVATPSGVATWNSWFHAVQEVDDATNYETLRQVEDTCRSMIASYKSDKLTYEQYKESDDETKQEWAEQAKMRANKTASTYNTFILKNNYVWKGNVPFDICNELEYIK